MLKYFQTSTLILIWCLIQSIAWSHLSYYLACKQQRHHRPIRSDINSARRFNIFPALLISPIVLVISFRSFDLNLLFPLHFFATKWELVHAAFYPAAILTISSGLLGSVFYCVHDEYRFWLGKPFATVARSLGKNPDVKIKRLVILKSLASSWSQCLPWLFGELIVVESIFNAPGLGLDAWHMARVRDIFGLGETLIWIMILYFVCLYSSCRISKWVGLRLESYG